jgi:hypothetical protein
MKQTGKRRRDHLHIIMSLRSLLAPLRAGRPWPLFVCVTPSHLERAGAAARRKSASARPPPANQTGSATGRRPLSAAFISRPQLGGRTMRAVRARSLGGAAGRPARKGLASRPAALHLRGPAAAGWPVGQLLARPTAGAGAQHERRQQQQQWTVTVHCVAGRRCAGSACSARN